MGARMRSLTIGISRTLKQTEGMAALYRAARQESKHRILFAYFAMVELVDLLIARLQWSL